MPPGGKHDWALMILDAGTTCWPTEGDTPEMRLVSSLKRAGLSASILKKVVEDALGPGRRSTVRPLGAVEKAGLFARLSPRVKGLLQPGLSVWRRILNV